MKSGTSLVIVNSEKGQYLFNEISTNVKYKEIDFKTAIKPNPSMTKPSSVNRKRSNFFKELNVLSFDVLINKYIKEPCIIKKVKNKLKRIIKS